MNLFEKIKKNYGTFLLIAVVSSFLIHFCLNCFLKFDSMSFFIHFDGFLTSMIFGLMVGLFSYILIIKSKERAASDNEIVVISSMSALIVSLISLLISLK